MLGIIGATSEEIELIVLSMTQCSTSTSYGIETVHGYLCGHFVVVACCGIGKVNASRCAQILICEYSVTEIINVGIAGGMIDSLSIGDVVISEAARYFDYDASGIGINIGEMLGMKESVFKADTKLVELAETSCKHVMKNNRYHKGLILSGDQFVVDLELKKRISDYFGGVCVDMEGAAIAQTAMMSDISWVIIRAISDYSNFDSINMINANKRLAISACSDIIQELVCNM